MSSVSLFFPGQGSQYVGMAQALEGHTSFEYLSRADKALGYPLSKIMLEGPEEELQLTQNTQPAILTHSVALFEKLNSILKEKNIKIDRVLGHSVGEYAALVAAGSLSFEDAVKAVHFRGKFMQEAVPPGRGKMFAILKVEEENVRKACLAASTDQEQVMPANYNEPSQIVISGHTEACHRAVKWLEENYQGSFRAVELKVSAPFHSSLMKPAAKKLEEFFHEIKFNPNSTAYIANIDAKEYAPGTSAEIIKSNLIKQVEGSVLWTQSLEKLSDNSLCLEVGPGRVLMGLARKINRHLKVLSLDKEESWNELEELLS